MDPSSRKMSQGEFLGISVAVGLVIAAYDVGVPTEIEDWLVWLFAWIPGMAPVAFGMAFGRWVETDLLGRGK